MPADNLETGQQFHRSWWIFIWPGVHFAPCLALCQQRAPPCADCGEEGHTVGSGSPSISAVTFAFSLWRDHRGRDSSAAQGNCQCLKQNSMKSHFFHVIETSCCFLFYFILVDKWRGVVWVIYLHTQVLGYIPNPLLLSISINLLWINDSNKHTLEGIKMTIILILGRSPLIFSSLHK
jgi:hypothetical protein